MFNLNEGEKGSVLDVLFQSREENLCALTESDKKKIEKLTKNNDSYDKLFKLIEGLSNNSEILDKIRNSLDSYIDKINIIGAYENERFYKIRIYRCSKFNIRMCSKIKCNFKREYIINWIIYSLLSCNLYLLVPTAIYFNNRRIYKTSIITC